MKKFLEYAIYFLIFLLPWQTRWIIKSGNLNGYSEYNTYSLYVTEIFLCAIALISLFYLIKKEKFRIQNSKFRIIYILPVALTVTAAILAFDPLLAFYTLLKISEGVVLASLICKLANLKKIIYAFSGGALIQASITIWQFFAQSSFSSKWLGIATQNASILGTSVIETESGRWLRAYGALPHPNILAGYLAIAVFLLIILYARGKTKFALPSIVILSVALFLTFSRASLIALLFGAFVFLLLNYKNKISFKKAGFAVFACVFSLAIFSFIYMPLLKTRFENTARLEEKSENERMQSYREAGKIIKHYPFFGTGPGNYTFAAKNDINPKLASYAYQPTHNIYLLFMAEFGILTFLSLITLIILLVKIFNLKFIILSPILIIGLFDHYPISLYAGIMLTGFIFGLCLLSQKSRAIG